jgi:hypothetical protein
MKSPSTAAFSASCLAGFILIAACGCQKPSTPAPQSPLAKDQPKPPQPSVDKNSFREVTAHLDPGGSVYLYSSTEALLTGLSSKLGPWRAMVGAIPGIDGADRDMVNAGFNALTGIIQRSGVEQITGLGRSVIAREKGLYVSKTILHHYPGQNAGYLWTLLGQSPHALQSLDLLPASTAIACLGDVNFQGIWAALEKEISNAGFPAATEFMKQLPDEFRAATGLKLDAVVASLVNETGIIVTLDESLKLSLPLGQKPVDMPSPGLLMFIKVKDDLVFDGLDRLINETPSLSKQVSRTDEPGLKMRSVRMPLPMPVPFGPAWARHGEYLMLATTEALIREVIAVEGGKKAGLKGTEEFKKLSAGMSTQGNNVTFVSERFGKTLGDIQRASLEAFVRSDEVAAKSLAYQFLGLGGGSGFLWINSNTPEGWMSVQHSSAAPGQSLIGAGMMQPAAVVGLLAAIAVPNFVKARTTAQRNACVANLRQIDGGMQQWALENKKPGNARVTVGDITPYFRYSKLPVCPAGGTYTITSLSEPPTCSVEGHSLK